MTESQINKYIDKLRYRTFKKVAPNVFKKFPNIDKKTLKEIINKRLHDIRTTLTHNRIYQVKIFSKHISS